MHNRRAVRLLGGLLLLFAAGTLVDAMAVGGDILLIVLGLLLAATSMKLFRLA
jgi:hypothetical protein